MVCISIIVPVYNVEKYLCTCLNSLIDQGLSEDEYEIILVNDGSNDGSLDICIHYAEKYNNIYVFSQKNQGVSSARNLGLSKARGEWVMFVDSDDYLCKDSLHYLLTNFLNSKYDGIRFWPRIRSDASIDENIDCKGAIVFVGSGYDFIKIYGLDTFCISFLYRKRFLEGHRICFGSYKIGEDFLFVSEYLLANPRLCSTSCKVYQYLIHPNSASTSRNKHHSRACVFDQLAANEKLLGILDKKDLKFLNPIVYKNSIEAIQGKFTLIFSRILSSDISIKEFKQVILNQKKIGLLPLPKAKSNIKAWTTTFGINLLVTIPLLLLPSKLLYAHFFVPYILPKLNRNK